MDKKFRHITLFFVLLLGVLVNTFAITREHSGSKLGIEKSAIGCKMVKAWEGLINIHALRKNIDWLTRSSKWIDEGAEFVTTNGVTKLRKGADDILEIKNEKILPNKKEHYYNGTSGTSIGEASNGYQVVKVGNDLKVQRVADEAPYVANGYLTKLKEHPNAHTLERHGHDVTDDALIKRANEGIAPDGSTIGSDPPYTLPDYSSKFESPDALKTAYDNTKPGSQAFINTPENPVGTKKVFHTLTNGTYGKGVGAGQNSFQNTNLVRATYVNDGNGNWQLVTMFPDF